MSWACFVINSTLIQPADSVQHPDLFLAVVRLSQMALYFDFKCFFGSSLVPKVQTTFVLLALRILSPRQTIKHDHRETPPRIRSERLSPRRGANTSGTAHCTITCVNACEHMRNKIASSDYEHIIHILLLQIHTHVYARGCNIGICSVPLLGSIRAYVLKQHKLAQMQKSEVYISKLLKIQKCMDLCRFPNAVPSARPYAFCTRTAPRECAGPEANLTTCPDKRVKYCHSRTNL